MRQEILEKRGKNQETELEKRGKLSYNQKENREKELSDDMKKKRAFERIILLPLALCVILSHTSAYARSAKSTIKELLQTGLQPVGSTMYIWGGGWNSEDTAAGKEARTIGVSKTWKKFFLKQTKNYNYRKYLYQNSKGLDCSGYIGWCIYNIMNTKSGQKGYVMHAGKMAKNFAARGWGTYTKKSKVKNYKAGDIMSSSGHVYMVVGQCRDGSVVLLHSSPPGVSLCGTSTPSGKSNSQAVKLAKKYMKKYYPAWYKKFPDCSRGVSYLQNYNQMRWDISGEKVMTDPDGYRKMTADKILKDLFEE